MRTSKSARGLWQLIFIVSGAGLESPRLLGGECPRGLAFPEKFNCGGKLVVTVLHHPTGGRRS